MATSRKPSTVPDVGFSQRPDTAASAGPSPRARWDAKSKVLRIVVPLAAFPAAVTVTIG